VASTESAPGRADGLPFDALTGVRAAPNGDVFALLGSSGTARLSGSSWSSFSVANTESAPGAGDGLVSNEVFDATRDSTGALWFSTNQGVSRRAGTTWTQFGPPQGLAGPIWQTWLSPQAEVYLGSDLGLYRLSP
jgi:hypothetical protein